ncbi:glycerophosphoryl diester phosphodiesterase [Alteribacillus persepolensis]|uniref:Glycerophosphoryl diester phosphodiesterase n=1 Tax=Alteribacillus persepolensis TaxID=568899 RepID=A0A1G8KAU5_9BACI|nr:glycerophosphodiester phosphodiesterase family protein [Alteribacillus persepolensis]SDI40541.1 glycerophosphoryl diester phosphodiesterase [Alteribacillus persepolensis]
MNKKLRIGLFMALLLFTSLPFGTAMAEEEVTKKEQKQVLNIAHRGASGHAPENTMAAFEKSVDMKADMFELDVQMSKDGELVVIHDTTVDRTTNGTGAVKDLTYEEIRELDAGSHFSDEFTGEKIPTLGEVLDEYRGKSGILIEVKSPSLYPGIAEKVADELTSRNMDKPNNNKIIVQSFDHDFVQTFHSLLPSVPVGVLISYNPFGISDSLLSEFTEYADYVNPNKDMMDASLLERIHSFGMETHPWTVRSQEAADSLLQLGVDGIITDYPDYVDPHKP